MERHVVRFHDSDSDSDEQAVIERLRKHTQKRIELDDESTSTNGGALRREEDTDRERGRAIRLRWWLV
jgi:hypothetical protein